MREGTASVTSLTEALGLGPREYLALVGAGGKTSLLFALARELQARGRRVLTTTTTKVWQREASQAPILRLVSADASWRKDMRRDLAGPGHVFLGMGLLESGKVQGVDGTLPDRLFEEEDLDYLLVEADGSAGRPAKAPAPHEPVIPLSVTGVVALLGLEALGQPVGQTTVFRPEVFERITGLQSGQSITPAALSVLLHHPDGLFRGAPASSRKMVFLNKADLLADPEGAGDLIRRVLDGAGVDVERVVIGSIRKGLYRIARRGDERDLLQDRGAL